jgi:hypothetical protein
MKTRRLRKIEHHINQGKAVCGFADSINTDLRTVTTMVCLRRTDDKMYRVEIEIFYADVDIRGMNIREENRSFFSLEEAISFIESATDVKFAQMRA